LHLELWGIPRTLGEILDSCEDRAAVDQFMDGLGGGDRNGLCAHGNGTKGQ